MNDSNQNARESALEVLSRSFFRQAAEHGFKQMDYLRFANLVLDMAVKARETNAESPRTRESVPPADEPAAPEHSENLLLRGTRLTIRRFDRDGDIGCFQEWMRDTHGRDFLLSRTTSRQADIRDIADSASSIIGVVTLPDATPIGSVAFLDYDPVQRKAELRKIIGVAALRGQGYAKEASRLWIQYGLSELGLKKIYLNTLYANLRNIKLNEELGFKVEGILRNEVFFDGAYHDVLRMGLWNG